MVKTYTLNERPIGPANVTAVAVALTHKGVAGTIPDGKTYYYKQIANGYNNFYDDVNAWISAPSSESNSVTTDSTHKVIWIHHDNNVSGQEETHTIRTEISGDYKQTDSNGVLQRHFPRVDNYSGNHYMGVKTLGLTEFERYEMTTSAIATLTEGETITGQTSGATALVVTNPSGGTTFKIWTVVGTFSTGELLDGSITGVGVGTYASTSAKDGWVIEDYTSALAYVFPVFDDGLPCLVCSSDDTADPVTPQDVYEWLIDNGTPQYCDGVSLFQDDDHMTTNGKNLCNFFTWRFNIYTTNFKIPGGIVVSQALAKHMFRNGEFTMGELGAQGQTTNGAGIIGAWHQAFYNTMARVDGSEIKIYGSIMGMTTANVGSCNKDPYYQINYKSTIKDSVIKSSGRWNPPLEINNSRMMVGGEVGHSGNANTNITENVNWNGHLGGSDNIQEATFKDSNINYRSNYVFYVDSYYLSTGCRTINANNMTYNYSDFTYLARIRSATAGTDNILRLSNTVKFKIVDKNGTAIENAEVYATDIDGNNGLFTDDWVARTYTNNGKTGTSITLDSGAVTVGKYYRAGDETIKIESGTHPIYTISRAQLGSTANNLGGSASTRMSYLYELDDYVETDSEGEVEILLNHQYYKSLNATTSYYIVDTDLLTRSPYDIQIKKEGYETFNLKYIAEEKKDMVIELKDAIPVMTTTDSQVAIKLDPTNSGVNRDKVIIN